MSDKDFLTIDELARAAGTTVRNVRVYQDRGLLPPPERRGRLGLYGPDHLRRLRLVLPGRPGQPAGSRRSALRLAPARAHAPNLNGSPEHVGQNLRQH